MVNFLNESNAQALSVVTYGMSLLVTNKFGKLNYKKKNIFSGSHIHQPPPNCISQEDIFPLFTSTGLINYMKVCLKKAIPCFLKRYLYSGA